MKRILVILSVLILATISCQATGTLQQPASPVENSNNVQPQQPQDLYSPPPEPGSLSALYESTLPGVVSIRVFSDVGSGAGSGFVFDEQGHILTNFHVVEGATEVEVDFSSGFKTYGTVIGTDLDSDLAVVKVEAPADELYPLPIGNSDLLRVGDTVIAIGNPFGLSGTMTTGIVSALGRTLDSLNDAPGGGFFTAGDIIQTDAAINPGNSGGPLFNINGEVIGINRAIRTTSFSNGGEPVNSGIGFAISINIVKRVAPAIIADGHYDYPYMGISSISDLNLHSIEALGLPRQTGAYVTAVSPDSPAEKAGVQGASTNGDGLPIGGDLIIGIDGTEVQQFDTLLKYLINNKGPGDIVTLTVLRDGQEITLEMTLDKRP
ncbi:MAG: PDZ domain-containing protein [Anaerolineae bacterium]|jgi:S1-C subfamily serine protease|nr:PDZ domain-containing protein [Anaerolineae bacterium]MBT7989425.1 PDZ domain-containing protein [Anaerolineae bacterium]